MQVTAPNSTLLTSNKEEQPAPVLNSDFETFLKMLTTQMQNQDPLNPVDSTEFATQLAMFTSVEQQVLTNDRLLSIQETLLGNELGQAADWVGKLARVEGDFVLGQAGMTFEFDPARTSIWCLRSPQPITNGSKKSGSRKTERWLFYKITLK